MQEGRDDCYIFSTSYKYIETPFMMLASQWDPVITDKMGCVAEQPGTDSDFWLSYREAAAELAENITREKPGSGLFLVSCATHAVVNTTWDTMPVATHADHSHHQEELLTTILTNWLNNRTPDKAMDRPDIVNPGCHKDEEGNTSAAAGDRKKSTLLLAMASLLVITFV